MPGCRGSTQSVSLLLFEEEFLCRKSNSSSFCVLSLYWEFLPNNTQSHISETSSLCSYGNDPECVWERSNCLFMWIGYSCVAYFYIMNQLLRLWRELIWIIADGGKRFCTQTWFCWASTHGISLREGATLGVCGGVYNGTTNWHHLLANLLPVH